MAARKQLTWRVEPEPTGRYGSFHTRAWPHGVLTSSLADGSEKWMIALSCDTRYSHTVMKTGDHGPITIRIADYSVGRDEELRKKYGAFRWLNVKQKVNTLGEAKEAAELLLAKYPHFLPTK